MVTLIALMCGLEPLLKSGQLEDSRQQAASNAIASAPLVLSNADLRQAKARLKEGDIIFRSGNTWFTRLVAPFTPNTPYAQGGIITFKGSRLMVVSALPEGTGSRLVEEPLANFLQNGKATGAAIYRLKAPTPAVQRAIATAAKTYPAKNNSFDSKFALSQNGYCTDFVLCAYLEAGIDLSSQGKESSAWPFMSQQVEPDSLASSASLRPVYRFDQVQSIQSSLP
ncbi:MAG: YiiX/YebB-like N1pC/P60 family cysteine hydrolase [Phormidesmis sp.]